jgi:hypothetical protein
VVFLVLFKNVPANEVISNNCRLIFVFSKICFELGLMCCCDLINTDRSWKKHLIIAKDARRLDVLCYRIYLSYRLLDGTSRFKELHGIVKDAKAKIETEVGPVDGVSAKMARGIVSRLSVAGDVQKLCSLAIEKADEWLTTISSANPNCRG